jgi:TRAP-type C4-dicarboxylate transport system substrate-binding protein
LGAYLKRRVSDTLPVRVPGFWDNGFRHFSNSVRPIRAPADYRGIRIRTQMSELHGEVFRALRFQPVAANIKKFIEEIGRSTQIAAGKTSTAASSPYSTSGKL